MCSVCVFRLACDHCAFQSRDPAVKRECRLNCVTHDIWVCCLSTELAGQSFLILWVKIHGAAQHMQEVQRRLTLPTSSRSCPSDCSVSDHYWAAGRLVSSSSEPHCPSSSSAPLLTLHRTHRCLHWHLCALPLSIYPCKTNSPPKQQHAPAGVVGHTLP